MGLKQKLHEAMAEEKRRRAEEQENARIDRLDCLAGRIGRDAVEDLGIKDAEMTLIRAEFGFELGHMWYQCIVTGNNRERVLVVKVKRHGETINSVPVSFSGQHEFEAALTAAMLSLVD